MAEISPFQGFVYNREMFQDLTPVLAPPYDVISPEQRVHLIASSPFNIVNLTVGETDSRGTPREEFYKEAADKWRSWQEEGVVVTVPEPAIWRIEQTFQSPDGRLLSRTGFVALIRLESRSGAGIHTHERTLDSPRQDRRRLLEETRANFSPIFFVYGDPSGNLDKIMEDYREVEETRATMNLEDRVDIRISYSTNRNWIDRFCSNVGESPILIADGHHRFEAALSFHRENQEDESVDTSFAMGYFVPSSSEGLIVFPVHRGIDGVSGRNLARLESALDDFLTADPSNDPGEPLPSLRVAVGRKKPVRMQMKSRVFETVTDRFSPGSDEAMGAVMFNEIIVKEILAAVLPENGDGYNIRYYSRENACLDDLERGAVQIAFLLDPVDIESLFEVASRGGILPPKSTYFFPKCPTGIVMHSLEKL